MVKAMETNVASLGLPPSHLKLEVLAGHT